MPTEHLLLRPADATDAQAVATVHLAAREAAYPFMPRGVHPDDEVRDHVAGQVVERCSEVWVADGPTGLLGYALATPTWLEALYVAPAHQRAGIGTALLDLVKALRPEGFGLWVFASNAPARDFYRRQGLRERETTDGRDNEERCPDVRMTWEPRRAG